MIMMRIHHIAFALAALILLAVPLPAASSDACHGFFFGGAPPASGGPMICKPGYAMAPLLGARIPAWSAEHLTAESVAGAEAAKRFGSFHVEQSLAPSDRSSNSDYAGSGYDKGHMTPVGDFGNQDEEADTFSLANMVPQRPELNRFLWQDIENAVRQLAKLHGEVWVITGPVVRDGAPRLKDRVAIPDETWKAVVTPDGVAGVYIATNTSAPTCRVLDLDAAIAEIGFNPIPGHVVGAPGASSPDRPPTIRPPPAIPARTGSAGCPSQ